MKKYLECFLLCAAIILISFGVHTEDSTIVILGGALVGVYSAMIYKQD